MADFILEYDILESIANNSKSLGKRSKEYSEKLESKIITGIDRVAGPSSGYLTSASDSVQDKINALKLKSDAFYHFADQISNLLEVAEQIDQEVADAIAAQREYFLDHHKALRIDDWKAKLLGLIVDIKNSIPLLDTIADILDGLNAVFEALADSIKHWYECEGGKYIVRAVGSVVVAAVSVALFVAAFPVSGFFAVCGAIGAGIAAINGITNVATSFRAADAAIDGNPAWAVIYGKQDKLSDVLRQTNFGSGGWNALSNLGAGALDTTETICDVVGFAEIGKNAIKLFKGDAFKLLKNKGSMNFSDLKNGSKSDIVDLKNNILDGYADSKNGIKEKIDNALKGGSESTVSKLTSSEVKAAIEKNGMSVDEFSKLLDPNKTLTPGELKLVDTIRADVGLPQSGTVMNKTIPQSDIYNYLYNENYSGVRGFVSVDEHSSALKTLDDVFEGNRLDYNNTAFKTGSGVDGISQSVGNADTVYGKITYVLEDADTIKVPTDFPTVENAPYTGRGFTGSKNIVLPELVQDNRSFIDGDILGVYDSETGTLTQQFVYDSDFGWVLK
ncbi:hypothetical protein QA584_08390 [Anaerocolumna sp. AGMB13025]|uniref:hypothetical protein n=1 Tax=Anaerocolumna sp. AGMB13025 TaxID=3039116 RepID=UPI00241CF801|nr:hypothetical protein [Anaerocolumna sp. AGMB13025]WFR59090.1 hypothetical protein QA584_08390 [Anaerocolumna sp. AGMB13025]